MRRPAAPPFAEPARAAWGAALTAIEAMDIDGLQRFARGRLAELLERAARHIGMPDCEPTTACDRARATGGVYDLGRFGVDPDTLATLLYQGGLRRVEDIERRTDRELLSIHRIGPKRLTMIRAAVSRYRGA